QHRRRMAPRKKLKSVPPVTLSTTVHDLPDSLLQHVLSFLPAQAAVRTCVLARRWRHLWRSTTGLRIVGLDDEENAQVQHLRKFVEHLLMLRERTNLESVEMKFHSCSDDEKSYVNLWICFALICKVRVLTLHILEDDYTCLLCLGT
uniref:F-box domain-containing protein n=1 Tax=Aegilops tauschii subsp. strangulata TaxID=200361 RepID=A0A453N0Z7_AEGTS